LIVLLVQVMLVNLGETWAVSELHPGLGRMQLVGDTYSITGGYAYGSNASLAQTSKASMSAIRATERKYVYEAHSWNKLKVTTVARGSAGSFTVSPSWNACTDGSCLGYVQENAGCDAASCLPEPGHRRVRRVREEARRQRRPAVLLPDRRPGRPPQQLRVLVRACRTTGATWRTATCGPCCR
jgi:hypothetical protein